MGQQLKQLGFNNEHDKEQNSDDPKMDYTFLEKLDDTLHNFKLFFPFTSGVKDPILKNKLSALSVNLAKYPIAETVNVKIYQSQFYGVAGLRGQEVMQTGEQSVSISLNVNSQSGKIVTQIGDAYLVQPSFRALSVFEPFNLSETQPEFNYYPIEIQRLCQLSGLNYQQNINPPRSSTKQTKNTGRQPYFACSW